MSEQEHYTTFKVLVAWILTAIGTITLNQVVEVAALIFSVLQSYFLLRDKWWRERKKKVTP